MSIHTDDAVTPFIEESRRFAMLSAEEELDLDRGHAALHEVRVDKAVSAVGRLRGQGQVSQPEL